MTTKTFVKIRDSKGTSNFGCTLEKKRENGRPLSRAKAQVILLDVVMIDVVAKSRQIKGKISKQTEPARELVASKMICRIGPAGELMTSSIGPATNKRHIRKTNPVKVPIQTQ